MCGGSWMDRGYLWWIYTPVAAGGLLSRELSLNGVNFPTPDCAIVLGLNSRRFLVSLLPSIDV